MRYRNQALLLILGLCSLSTARAETNKTHRVELLCHRTANEDVPENTLESLQQAALLGCDVVEIDLRKTLDGQIVLNHDGFLERLTDGIGVAESSYYDDLASRDAGSWMGERFAHLHVALFEDALRLARKLNIQLILDIKTKGIGEDVLTLLKQENMLERVRFGGEWADVKLLYPQANSGASASEATVWVQPGISEAQVKAHHAAGKAVVANFSVNVHAMDLVAMKAAVAAGVDGINVDYPRIGADAAGRPVEQKIDELLSAAKSGDSHARSSAVLSLSRYRGFDLEPQFARLLLDRDDPVSRAAALALVASWPKPATATFAGALRSKNSSSRANAAWALGMLAEDAQILLPLLRDRDPHVLAETLLAISRMPGQVSANDLLPLLVHEDPEVRGTATLALARHQPQVAEQAVPEALKRDVETARTLYDDYVRRGKPQLTPEEIRVITGHYQCEMKMVQAVAMLRTREVTRVLEQEAFRPAEDFSQMNGVVAAFRLWDLVGQDDAAAQAAVKALGSESSIAADHAEWTLVQGGPGVLPEVRKALTSDEAPLRARAIQIVGWQGDEASLQQLQHMLATDRSQADLIRWAIEKITEVVKMRKIIDEPATHCAATQNCGGK